MRPAFGCRMAAASFPTLNPLTQANPTKGGLSCLASQQSHLPQRHLRSVLPRLRPPWPTTLLALKTLQEKDVLARSNKMRRRPSYRGAEHHPREHDPSSRLVGRAETKVGRRQISPVNFFAGSLSEPPVRGRLAADFLPLPEPLDCDSTDGLRPRGSEGTGSHSGGRAIATNGGCNGLLKPLFKSHSQRYAACR